MSPTLTDYLGIVLTPSGNPAQGDMVVRGVSGGWTTIPIGSPNEALVSDSITGLPVWKGLVGIGGPTGATGPPGPPGNIANWRGIWVIGTTYALGDGVMASNNHWYVSIVSGNIGHDPTTDSSVHWSDTERTIFDLLNINTLVPHGLAVDASGLLDANLDGNNPGGGSNAPERLVLNLTTANGSNGSRGNAINVDTGNSNGVFFSPIVAQTAGGSTGVAFSTKGSLSLFTGIGRVRDDGSNSYREFDCFEAAVYTQSLGAYSLGMEILNHISTPSAFTGAGPARASGITIAIQEDNPISAYPTALGADSTGNTYGMSGARGIALRSVGAQPAGSAVYVDGQWVNGIMCRVTTGTIILQNQLFGVTVPTFTIDGLGAISWGPSTGALDVSLGRTAAQTVTLTGKLIVTSDVSLSGFAKLIGNNSGAYPPDELGGAIGVNFSGGFAEVDFWNTQDPAGVEAQHSFSFWQKTGPSAASEILRLTDQVFGTAGVPGALLYGDTGIVRSGAGLYVLDPTKPTITGSRGGNAALASLLTALAAKGYLTDSTT